MIDERPLNLDPLFSEMFRSDYGSLNGSTKPVWTAEGSYAALGAAQGPEDLCQVQFADAQTDSRYETRHRCKRGLDVQSSK